MKKYYLFAMLLALAVIRPPAAHAGLIAYFDFEGDATDSVGGYDGTVYGATLTAGYGGGQAYAFDGNDFIYVGLDINATVLPQLTMGAWVKAYSSTPVQQVISHDNEQYDRSLGIDLRGGGTGWSAFSGSGQVLGYETVNLNTWTFLAVAYDQSTSSVRLYVNGNEYSESGSLGPGYDYLAIGANPYSILTSYHEFFHGVIDEVFFYSDALTTAQLDDIRLNGVGAEVPEPGTMLLFGAGLCSLIGGRLSRKNASAR